VSSNCLDPKMNQIQRKRNTAEEMAVAHKEVAQVEKR
jgi:hypothetical protein